MGGGDVHMGFWWGKQKERDHLEDPEIDGRIILQLIYKKGIGVWTGLICLMIRRLGEIL
jgi:hypothetical protein